MSDGKRTKLSQVLCLGFLLAVFLGQYLLFGYERVVDTLALENFSNDVYPVYPLALGLFRTAFGEDRGYFLLGVFQNVIHALCIFALTDYLRREYKLSGFVFWSASAGVSLLFIIQRWATATGTVSSNTLFSEAFSIPFYLVFFRFALESFISRERKPFLLSCVWAVILILTRGQFYWLIVIVFLNGLRLGGVERKKAFLGAVLACAGVLVPVWAGRYLQTVNRGNEQTKNPANLIVMTTAVYCSEADDALLFEEGSGERRLMEITRVSMDDPVYPMARSYETGDFIQRHMLFEKVYDSLKVTIKNAYDQVTAEGRDVSLGRITRTLILANLPSFLQHCGRNAWVGLIRTVALLRPGLDIFALLLYAAMLMIAAGRHREEFGSIGRFLSLGLLCSLLNALVMAPGVFAQSRYVFYNMPVLYLGLGVYATLMCRSIVSRLLNR